MHYDDLDPEQQRDIDQLLKDGSIDMIHDARGGLADAWSLQRKEKHMKREAKKVWDAIAAAVAGELPRHAGIEPDDELMKSLATVHEDLFIDAASWSDYD